MKNILLLAALAFPLFSQARTLNCALKNWDSDGTILSAALELDNKPTKPGTSRETQVHQELDMVIDGNPGKLCMDLKAIWFYDALNSQYATEPIKVNNMRDTFPYLNTKALFYRSEKCPTIYPGPSSYIHINTSDTPGFNVNRSKNYPAKYVMDINNPQYEFAYHLSCEVK
jgi:hypothetical protein